jgi:tetratricopeptide (TPR) repeat protein
VCVPCFRPRALGALLLGLAVLAGRAAGAAPKADVAQLTTRSSVWVLAPQDRKLMLTGTGWVYDVKDRLVITNYHVVGQATAVSVMFPLYVDEKLITAREEYTRRYRTGELVLRGTVLATDSGRDLALIQLEKLPLLISKLELAEPGAKPGHRVHFVGNPGDSKQLWVHATGTVSRAAEDLVIEINTGLQFKANMLSVDVDQVIRPGYSGGPVVNENGEVVGVSTTLRRAGKSAGCVDVAEVRAFVKNARACVNPRTAEDYKAVGKFHLDQKRYDRAIEAFRQALALKAADPADLFVLLGTAQVKKGDYDKALADYNQAVKLNGKYAWAYQNRGDLFRLLGRHDLAVADFRRTLECSPQTALAHYGLSLVYRAKNDLKKAEEHYRKALALAPSLASEQPELPPEQGRPGDEVEKYLPNDADFVLAVDVKQLVKGEAFARQCRARLERLVKDPQGWQIVLAGLGVDPARDLTRLVLAGPARDADANLRVLVQGHFDPERFRTLADNEYKVTEVPDELGGRYRLYELGDGVRRGAAFFALASPTTVVFSPSRDAVLDALKKGAGWKRTVLEQDGVRVGLDHVATTPGLWLVLADGAGALNLAEVTPSTVLAAPGSAEQAQEEAGRLGQELERLQEAVRAAAVRRPEVAPLGELVTAVEVKAAGDRVLLSARGPTGRAPAAKKVVALR